MSTHQPYIVAFDLDKTILTLNSSKLLVKASRQTGLMSKRDFRRAIYYSLIYKFDLKDANKIVSEMTGWLRGLKESDVVSLIDTHAVPEMLKLIRPEIRNEIKRHKDNHARLILLSSALPYLCDPIARDLEMDDIVCSKLQLRDGIFTGKPEGRLVFGKEKRIRMKEYCTSNNFPLDTAWYYGDAFTDRFVMLAVGNPVCVKPELKLGWMAKRRGWKII